MLSSYGCMLYNFIYIKFKEEQNQCMIGVSQGMGCPFQGEGNESKEHQRAPWVTAKSFFSWSGFGYLGMFSLWTHDTAYNMHIFSMCVIFNKKLNQKKNLPCQIVFLNLLIYATLLAKLFIWNPVTLLCFLHSICHWLKSSSLLFLYVCFWDSWWGLFKFCGKSGWCSIVIYATGKGVCRCMSKQI